MKKRYALPLIIALWALAGFCLAQVTTGDVLATLQQWASDAQWHLEDETGVDTTPPVLTVVGGNQLSLVVGATYNDTLYPCSCTDDVDGNCDANILYSGTVNTAVAATYTRYCDAADAAGNAATQKARAIVVVEAGVIAFTNVTTSIIDQSPGVDSAFWSGLTDVNGDGCIDAFIGTHSDNYGSTPPGGNSAMFIHDVVDSICQGTFTYYDRRQTSPAAVDCDTGYSQDQQCNGLGRRITSRYHFININDDADGLPSFTGADADSGSASYYQIRPASVVGGLPLYEETTGNPGTRARPTFLELEGDGVLDLVTSAVSGGDQHTIQLSHIAVSDGLATATVDYRISNDPSDTSLAFDVDGDTYPDLINISNDLVSAFTGRGYWRYNPSTGNLDRVDSAFSEPWFLTEDPDCRKFAGNYQSWIDYDSDGDMDLLFGSGVYDNNEDGSGNCGVVQDDKFFFALYRNDGSGTFVDVTDPSGLDTANLRNQFYYSTYQGAPICDINNDGYPDIIYGGWASTGDTIAILLNNGDGTFAPGVQIETPALSGLRPWTNMGDYDNDGLCDLIMIGTNGALNDVTILKNATPTSNHFMFVRGRGVGANTDGFHIKYTWYEPGTSTVITTRLGGMMAHSQDEIVIHAGMGTNTAADLVVQFPHGGDECTFEDLAVDKWYITFDPRETGLGCVIEDYTPGYPWPMTPSQSLTLTPNADATMGATELITVGIPFKHGQLCDLDELRVVDETGAEVAIYPESTMTWHFKAVDNTCIRAAKVQFVADMTGGALTYRFFVGGRTTASDLTEDTITRVASSDANHDTVDLPRVFVHHDPDYLLASNIVPPMAAQSANVYDDTFFPAIFANYGDIDYGTSGFDEWQFDRVTAIGKQYMRTGSAAYHKEMLASAQFYFAQFTGVAAYTASTDCMGHFTLKSDCDPKYTYPQAAKIYLALTGDDETVTSTLVTDMVQFTLQKAPAEFKGWKDPYVMGNFYTERRAGWRVEASVAGCEILGDSGICNALPGFVDNLWNHVFDNPDTQTPAIDGSHRHSWTRHEGGTYPGDDVASDLRFSPWMMPLITDTLWQYWHMLPAGATRTKVEQILAGHGQALALYGFNRTSYSTATRDALESAYSATITTYSNTARAQAWGCNVAPSPVMAYSGTSVYTPPLDDGDHFPFATDSHNSEAVFTLSVAAYFETNAAKRAALLDVAEDIIAGFYPNCGDDSNVARWLGWSTRASPWPTYKWVNDRVGN